MLIDKEAFSQPVPLLQIVNGILSSSSAERMGFQDGTIADVNGVLYTLRYPNTLPFHFPHAQVTAVAKLRNTTLGMLIMQQLVGVGDYLGFSDVLDVSKLIGPPQILLSGLGPGQLAMLIEETVSLPDGPLRTKWYEANFGPVMGAKWAHDIAVGEDANSELSFADLTAATGLFADDAVAICARLCGEQRWLPLSSVVLSSAVPNGYGTEVVSADLSTEYGAWALNYFGGDAVPVGLTAYQGYLSIGPFDDARMDTLNRMVRMAKWTGKPYGGLDLLIRAVYESHQPKVNSKIFQRATARAYGIYQMYSEAYGISIESFAAWLWLVTPYAVQPARSFFDRIFNSNGKSETELLLDGSFFLFMDEYGEQTPADLQTVRSIMQALSINQRDFMYIANAIHGCMPNKEEHINALPRTLTVMSAFYRIVSLFKVFGIKATDFDVVAGWVTGSKGLAPIVFPKLLSDQPEDFGGILISLKFLADWLNKMGLGMGDCKRIAGRGQDYIGDGIQGSERVDRFISDVQAAMTGFYITEEQWKSCGATQYVEVVRDGAQGSEWELIDWLKVLLPHSDSSGVVLKNGFVNTPYGTTLKQMESRVEKAIEKDDTLSKELTVAAKKISAEKLGALLCQAQQDQYNCWFEKIQNFVSADFDVLLSEIPLFLQWRYTDFTAELRTTLGLKDALDAEPLKRLDAVEQVREYLRCVEWMADFTETYGLSLIGLSFFVNNLNLFAAEEPQFRDAGPSVKLQYRVSRYVDMMSIVSGKEQDVINYFFAASKDSQNSQDPYLLLSTLFGWDLDSVMLASKYCKAHWTLSTNAHINADVVIDMPGMDAFMRVYSQYLQTGMAVSGLISLGSLDLDSTSYAEWSSLGGAMVATMDQASGVYGITGSLAGEARNA